MFGHGSARRRALTLATAFATTAGLVAVAPASHAAGEAGLSALDAAYVQSFDSLVSSGTGVESDLPAGWTLLEAGTNANTSYAAGTGSGTGGDTYSLGTAGAPDRAFGSLNSGSNSPTVGVVLTNSTGATITSLDLAFTAEQWRLGGATTARTDRLVFGYSTDATGLADGTWLAAPALDATSTLTSGTAAALDGNAAANRSAVTGSVTGLSVAPGARIVLRWASQDVSGSDDALGIDDLSITPRGIPTGGPTDPSGTGSADPTSIAQGGQTTLTVAVTPGTNPASTGLAVSADLTAIGGSATTPLLDDGVAPDATAGDDIFSASATVDPAAAPGTTSLPFTITDAQDRSASGSIPLTVTATNPCAAEDQSIGSVQTDGAVGITGQVTVQGQTQISSTTGIAPCGTTGTVTPTEVSLPVDSATDGFEPYEGMLVTFAQELSVTEHFQLGRFGQVTLSSGGRLQQPTNVVAPGAAALALQAENNKRRIIVDDATQAQNPDPIVFARGGSPLSSASPNNSRVRPIGALGGGAPDFVPANARPTTAPAVGGTLKAVGMNLLNYFNTFGTGACTGGTTGAAMDCRGADNQAEFDRQAAKTLAAIQAMNPDVLGVNEIENDGYGPSSALADLVDRLNAAMGAGTYAYLDVDARSGQVDALGADAIKVGMIYKPASVTPVGTTAVLNSAAFVTGGDPDPRNRATVAQAFTENASGETFVFNVNHLKSKGSACSVPDAGDGQGNCNQVRLNAVNALTSWLAGDPTGTGDPDVLLVGDYNSYAMEDPITALQNAGFVHLIKARLGADAYSYAFDGHQRRRAVGAGLQHQLQVPVAGRLSLCPG